MTIRIKDLAIYWVVAIVNVLVFLSYNIFDYNNRSVYITSYAIITTIYIAMFCTLKKDNVLGFIIFICGFTLYVFPYLGSILREEYYNLLFYSLYLIFPLAFSFKKFEKRFNNIKVNVRHNNKFFLVSVFLSLAGLYLWMPIHYGFYGVSLIFIERSCKANLRRLALMQSLLIMLVIVYYSVFLWSGYGRLVLAVYIALPLLLLIKYKIIKSRPLLYASVIPVLLVFSTYLRYKDFSSLSSFAGDSAAHHLIIMTKIYNNIDAFNFEFIAIIDQLSLYFGSWFPRELWHTKPLGFAFTIVDEYLGRDGYGATYTASPGFWGEHFYYLQHLGLISGLIVIMLTLAMSNLLNKYYHNYFTPILVFQVNIISLVWGGMSTFGARVWWLLIPILVFLSAQKRIKKLINGESV